MNTHVKDHSHHTGSELESTTQRHLSLEGLEGRSVLAGDVFAATLGGNLLIQGDADANGIHIQNMNDGTVEVSGVEAGGSATTINGSSEPFVASDVHFLTRVELGSGDDSLTVDHEARASTESTTGPGVVANANVGSNNGLSLSERLSGLLNGVGRDVNISGQQKLLIHSGSGHDTVNAAVSDDVDVQHLGNVNDDVNEDNVSVHSSSHVAANGSLTSGNSSVGDSEDDTSSSDNIHLQTAASADSSSDLSLDQNGVDAALNTDLNVAIDQAGQATAGGIGTNADLDSVLTADLALSPALNSSGNVGSSSLLNTDQNINGSIGGAAALNLTGDTLFDEVGQFNNSSLANIDTALAAQIALANANSFGVSGNNVDNFLANLQGQNNLNAAANLNVDANLAASQGNFDLAPNGSLNTNVNANLNSAYQSRLGVPLG